MGKTRAIQIDRYLSEWKKKTITLTEILQMEEKSHSEWGINIKFKDGKRHRMQLDDKPYDFKNFDRFETVLRQAQQG